MTPARLDEIPYDAKQEIERLQAELAKMDLLKTAAEMALMECEGELEQAKERERQLQMKYQEQKRCCTVCDLKKICTICGDVTLMACSDCRIDLGSTVYVCGKSACRDQHERKCPKELEAANARLQSENNYLKEVIAAPDKPRYAQLLGENARLRETLEEGRTAISNLATMAGHESVVLRKHPEPCRHLDFCVVKDAMRRYAIIEAALTVPPAPADEKEAWLDGRARVRPAKEQP